MTTFLVSSDDKTLCPNTSQNAAQIYEVVIDEGQSSWARKSDQCKAYFLPQIVDN